MRGTCPLLRSAVLAIFTILTALLAACDSARVAGESVLHRGNGPDPATLDPHRRHDEPSARILVDLFEGLVAYGPTGELVPGVAASWSTDETGENWRFHLRGDARWCDGTPVTAGDFAAAFAKVRDPVTAAPFAWMLDAVAGAEAIDPHTLVITLGRPAPLLLHALAQSVASPLHPSARSGDEAVGNGAYCITERRPQAYVRLDRNPHYWDAAHVEIQTVYFHTIEDLDAEFNRYRAGELHVTAGIPSGRERWIAERHPGEFRHDPVLASSYLVFNLDAPPFADDVNLRRSLGAAIDRRRLAEVVFGGYVVPAYGIVPPMPGYEPRPPPVQALAHAASTRFTLHYPSGGPSPRIATVVAAMWRERLGVEVESSQAEWQVYLSRVHGGSTPGVFRYAWGADIPDPLSFLKVFVSGNPFGYSSASYDALLDRAETEGDPSARAALLAEAEALLLDDAAVVPLYFDTSRRLVSPRVRGWQPQPLDLNPTRWLSLEAPR